MPRPVQPDQRYVSGLDGLRAIAVALVVVYHLDPTILPGGLLGVAIFFTLSGYLITDLLMSQRERFGRFQLGQFWLRRARRLLPALFVVLAAVTMWVVAVDRTRAPRLPGEIASAAGYVTNWWVIGHHVSYFDRFAPPSPLGHLWSLAVEEQFYLFWPWLLVVGALLVRRLAHRRALMALLTLALAAGSAAEMAALFHPGVDPTRVYDGTDTRAFGLLIGAALAMVWPSARLVAAVRGRRWLFDASGVVGLLAIGVLVARAADYSPMLFRGGLVELSVATALVVAAVVVPGSRLNALLGWGPLRWLGVRSYGIYLWHLPVIVLSTPDGNPAPSLARALGQVIATLTLAALSWRYIESPIRSGALGRVWRELRARRRVPARAVLASSTATAALVVMAVVVAGGVAFPPSASAGSTGHETTETDAQSVTVRTPPSPGPSPTVSTSGQTSCQEVAHIGDSTSEGLISSYVLPDPTQRIAAQYARVGVTTERFEISGARSLIESYHGQPNGLQVARQLAAEGFHGCWVVVLGDNDAANIAVGATVPLASRIDQLMAIVGNQPVMWVNVKTLIRSGPYAQANMEKWNAALVQACPRYPQMRVFDWASVVQDDWFNSDHAHYTSAGYAQRGRLIADALAKAFPAEGSSPGCVVR